MSRVSIIRNGLASSKYRHNVEVITATHHDVISRARDVIGRRDDAMEIGHHDVSASLSSSKSRRPP